MRRGTAVALVVASAACFGTLAVLTSLAYDVGARPLPTLTWRFGIAAVAMAGYLLVRRPSSLRVGPRELARFGVLSLTGYGAASLCFFFALRHISPSVATVLLYTYPALIALFEAASGRTRLHRATLAAIALTFLGCVLVVGVLEHDITVSVPGVALALGAGVAYGVFTILSDRLVPGRSRLVVMTYMFAISAALMAGISMATGETLSVAGWSARQWSLVLAIVAVPTIAAVVLYMGGIRRLGPARAALASTTEPVFTIGMSWMLLGERLSVLQLLGTVLVVAGIILAEHAEQSTPSAVTVDVPAI